MKVVKFSVAVLMGWLLTLVIASQIAMAQPDVAPVQQGGKDPKPGSLFTYAWVITSNVQVYANPGDAVPVRDLGAGYLYVLSLIHI